MWTRAGMIRYPVFVALSLAAFAVGAWALVRDDGRLADGVYIQGVNVGGLTTDAAERVLRERLADQLPASLTFTAGDAKFQLPNDTIGRHIDYQAALTKAHDLSREGGLIGRAGRRLSLAHQPRQVPLPVVLDRGKLAAKLRALAPKVVQPAKNARVTSIKGGAMAIAPATAGAQLNMPRTLAVAENGGALPAPDVVGLVLDEVAPTVREADLRRDLNVVLSRFSTNMYNHYGSPMRENRRYNVELCLPRFRGLVLGPGEEFSFNGNIGERKVSEGFKNSVVFKRRADGTIDEEWESGGGICQLATTLFDAAVLANLKITERQNHSKVVGYSRIARDAAVYWESADLKFVNPLSHPIMIWGEMEDWDLVITIMGDQSDKVNVEMISDSWQGGAGQGGTLWRTVKGADGQVIKDREWICNSFYPYEKKPEKPKPTPAATPATPAAPAKPAAGKPATPAADTKGGAAASARADDRKSEPDSKSEGREEPKAKPPEPKHHEQHDKQE